MAIIDETRIATVDDTSLVVTGDALSREIEALRVVDDPSFQRAAELRRGLGGWIKTAEEFFAPMKSAGFKTWRAICDRESAVIGPKKAMYKALGERMADHEQAMQRRRQAAEAAAQRERERLEAEARAAAEAEEARLRAEAQDRILEDAIAAEEIGDTQAVAFLLEEPAYIPQVQAQPVFVPPVQVSMPTSKGTSFTSTWDFEIVNEAQIPRQYLMPDLKQIGAIVRAQGRRTQIPGIKVVERRIAKTRVR